MLSRSPFSGPLATAALASGLALMTLGCVDLRPFDEVRAAASPGRYLDVDGRQVYVEVRGAGAPVVLIHGYGGSSYSWRHLVPRLAESYRTVALDLYGFGFTERPPERAAYSRSGQLRLLTGVMDELGIDAAHLIGHSYGGGLVQTLAHQQPDRVRSLVLVSSSSPDYPAARKNPLAGAPPLVQLYVRSCALRRAFVRRSLERSFFDDALVTGELVDAYRARLRVAGAPRAFRGLGDPVRAAADRAAVPYAEIRQPVLAIWGAHDRLVPPSEARGKVEQMADSRFVVLPDCGHLPMEERPDAVLELIEEFLQTVD